MSWTLCIESHYHFLPFQSWILHHNFSTGGLKLNRARIPNCPSRSETAFALMEKGSEQCIIQRALYSTSDGDDVSWVTHAGPCVYDPLTWNIIPMSPAPPALLDDGIRILNYQWLDFIKADHPNWGLSEGGGGGDVIVLQGAAMTTWQDSHLMSVVFIMLIRGMNEHGAVCDWCSIFLNMWKGG